MARASGGAICSSQEQKFRFNIESRTGRGRFSKNFRRAKNRKRDARFHATFRDVAGAEEKCPRRIFATYSKRFRST